MNNSFSHSIPSLADFTRLPPDCLMAFGAVYAPDMGLAELKYCQQFYINRNYATPTQDELAFLNALVAKNYTTPDSFLVFQMLTDDKFTASSFHDLMNKRAAVSPSYTTPCSLTEILQVAQKYLAAHPKKPSFLDSLVFSCKKNHLLSIVAEKAVPSLLDGDVQTGLSGGYKLPHALVCRTPISCGDKIFALLDSTDTIPHFQDKLLAFASSASVIQHVKKLCPVDRNGVLWQLASLNAGVDVDLSGLYGKSAKASRLLDQDVGMLFVVKESEAASVLMDALDTGLRPRLVGQIGKHTKMTIYQNNTTPLSFPLSAIKTFSFSRAYCAEINPQKTNSHSITLSEGEKVQVGNHNIFLARADGNDAHNASLYAAISAVAICIAHGAGLRDIRIAERLSLSLSDTSAENIGKQLAMLLGLYRAEVELELSELCSEAVAENNTASFTLYAAVAEPQKEISNTLTATNSYVYLLECAYHADGNPDFENLKKMFSYVEYLNQGNMVLSAKAVCGNVVPALESMSKNSFTEYLLSKPYVAKAGSILIETTHQIQGILIAKTSLPTEAVSENPNNSALLTDQQTKETK